MNCLDTDVAYGLRFFDSGGDGPALVLLHGLGNSLDYWTSIAPQLAANYRVLAVDIPGFGKSESPRSGSLDDFVAPIANMLMERNVGTAVVVGHSMGGIVAMALAGRKDFDCRSLVLVSGHLFTAVEILQRPSLALHDAAISLNLVSQFVGGSVPLGEFGARVVSRNPVVRELALWPFIRHPQSADPELLECALRNNGGVGAWRAAGIGRSVDLEAVAAAVPVPVKLVYGRDDRLLCADRDTETAARLMQIDSVDVIDDCGHWPMIESPEVLVALLGR